MTRLIARGFCQKFGEDYIDIFAPVSKYNTIRLIRVIAAHRAQYRSEVKYF